MIVVAALTAIVYAPALTGYFHADDWFLLFHKIGWKGCLKTFSGEWFNGLRGIGGPYRPLGRLSIELDRTLYGMNAAGFHLTSLLLHVLNGWLCFWLFRRLLRNAGWALAGAALFTVSPTHVEAVYWVAARPGLFCLAFMILALGFHYRAASEGRPWLLAPAFAAMALGLMSKEGAAALPLMMAATEFVLWFDASGGRDGNTHRLLDRCARRSRLRAVAVRLAPFFLLLAGFVVFRKIIMERIDLYGVKLTLAAVDHTYGTFIGTLVNPFFGRPLFLPDLSRAPGAAALLKSRALVGIAALAVCWAVFRCPRAGGMGLLWMLAACLPPLTLGVTYEHDGRLAYEPALGFVLFLSALGCACERMFAPSRVGPSRREGHREGHIDFAQSENHVPLGERDLQAGHDAGPPSASAWRWGEAGLWALVLALGVAYGARARMNLSQWLEAAGIMRSAHASINAFLDAENARGHEVRRVIAIDPPVKLRGAYVYNGYCVFAAVKAIRHDPNLDVTVGFRPGDAEGATVLHFIDGGRRLEWSRVARVETETWEGRRLFEALKPGAGVDCRLDAIASGSAALDIVVDGPESGLFMKLNPFEAYTLWTMEGRQNPARGDGAFGWSVAPGVPPVWRALPTFPAPEETNGQRAVKSQTLPPCREPACWLAWLPSACGPRRIHLERLFVRRFFLERYPGKAG